MGRGAGRDEGHPLLPHGGAGGPGGPEGHRGGAALLIERDLARRALALGLATAAYGLAFGVLCADAGLSVAQAAGFSSLVFTGSAQFAAVLSLAGGGSVPAAVVAGLLLNLRCLGFGIALAPVLRGSLGSRLLASQVLIDESSALALAEDDPGRARRAFWAGGTSVFVLWNASTLLGVGLGGAVGGALPRLGVDAAFPAGFLALVWPRLATPAGRLAALVGAAVAVGLTPVLRPGVPVVLAALGAVAALPLLRRSEAA